ncbi:MAG: fused MFS/spermidine synthase, partial [Pseudomonadota bacterium]
MRIIAIICFFFSGASALVFQVVWTRLFSLVFGTSTLAISTVLTAFMGGLALGSYLAGRLADRLRDPLRVYALAEFGVGVCALLLPLVVATFNGANQYIYQHFQQNYILLAGIRFVLSASVILIPTTLMGATLPFLSRYFVQTKAEHAQVGMRVGTLYAINTSGAVLGALLGGFILLPELGLQLTNKLAAGTNFGLAILVAIAYWVRRFRPLLSQVDQEISELMIQVATESIVKPDVNRRAQSTTLVAFAFSGAAAMIYQVIWSRALSMTIGSSVYSFTIVLVTFLIGLAGGAAVVGKMVSKSRNPVGLLALNHLALAFMVGISYLLTDKLSLIYLFLMQGNTMDATHILWRQFFLAMLIILPATFAMGATMPLTIRICVPFLKSVGRSVGTVYSVNTVGAILGSFAAGFLVIPFLQLQGGIFAAVCINLGIAALLGCLASWDRKMKVAIPLVALSMVIAGYLLPRWDLYNLSLGVFRPTIARDAMHSAWERPKLIYYHDGISTTVSVEQWSSKQYSLKNNGKVDASTGDDMPTQIAVG